MKIILPLLIVELLSSTAVCAPIADKVSTPAIPIYVGGIVDVAKFEQPANSTIYRSLGGAFYLHETEMLEHVSGACGSARGDAEMQGVKSSFTEQARVSPPAMFEIGMMTNLLLDAIFKCDIPPTGLSFGSRLMVGVNVDQVNGISNDPNFDPNFDYENPSEQVISLKNQIGYELAQWKLLVDDAKTHGFTIISPYITPNIHSEAAHDFLSDQYWSPSKALVAYGGGIALDTAPWVEGLILPGDGGGPGYRTLVQEEIYWAHRSHYDVTLSLQPRGGSTTNISDMTTWYAHTAAGPGGQPNAVVFQNYNGGTTPGVGKETDGNGLLAAADNLFSAINPITVGSGPDTLTITVSADRFQGVDANIAVILDNKVKLVADVTAQHSSRSAQNFVIRGTFGPAAHVVGVKLNNYARGPDGARNLYINGIALDGVTDGGQELQKTEWFKVLFPATN